MPKRVDRLIATLLTEQPDTHVVFNNAITPDSYVLNALGDTNVLYVHSSHKPAVVRHSTWRQSQSDSDELHFLARRG